MTTRISQEEMALQRDFIKKVAEINAQNAPPVAHVHTFGCQQNVSDGEKIKGMLALMGYGFSDTPDGADLVIFNTCAVRENAEDRVFGNLGALKHEKAKNPEMLIGVCGCMVEQQHITKKLKQSFPHVDLVFGTNALHTLPKLIYEQLNIENREKRRRTFFIPEGDGVIAEGVPLRRENPFKASIPIMYGCNNFCSYCIVPFVRGRERSREVPDILAEARSAIDGGARELLLLGQNVNSYGKEPGTSFSELLREINALDGEFRICYMSSHPKDFSRELIDTIASCEKVTRHFHLPVQSGSDRILELMNRHYTREDYFAIVDYIRERVPDAALTSDIIVGFPGETYDDFKDTLSLIERVKFDSLYTFIYSPRKGTKAAEMPDPISAEEKGKWFAELLEVQGRLGENAYNRYVGQTLRVLCEGGGRTDPAFLTGKTPQDAIVDFAGDKSLIGKFVNVKIEKALNWALIGSIVN
ncbi:MAG: tRNA (N6-isopentenyl adenosine(37)-C2)-methylthiotransferase MiaB [Oscillospiraceae bacterium]|nr:tRNA (N6-isopentenyl adenosine(37)-C2)-methylthiotransferase MiaB [Oscillospiraceae bacterium]